MPLDLNSVLLKISPAINDQFIGLEATYAELKTNEEKLIFIELCINVLKNQTINFNRCSDNPLIQGYFSYIKDCFINAKNRLFAHNPEVQDSDEFIIALFARLVMLKSLAKLALQNKNEFPPAFVKAFISITKELQSQFANLPALMSRHVIFKGQVITSLSEIDDIFARQINLKKEIHNSRMPTTLLMAVSFYSAMISYATKSPTLVMYGFMFLTLDHFIDYVELMVRDTMNVDNMRDLRKLKVALNAQPEASTKVNEKNLEHFIISADDVRNLESLLVPVIEEEHAEIVTMRRPGVASS